MSQSNWKKDRAGKYVRFRRVDGTLFVDIVIRVGGLWMASTGEKGGERIGDRKGFKTRMAATSALDSGIEKMAEQKETPKPVEKREDCGNCGGSGIFRGGGRVENGVYKGFEGVCFQCEGKGWQSDADRRRNWGYNQHRRIHP